ncbi:hypothetical protein BDW72DRAFT_214853 [Aspergillus terricola var. indicus]
MDLSRPPKRIRQACEQCRRKKSRCPGERPNCSSCLRLGQICEYAGDEEAAYARKMEQRIEGIEGKIDALMACFSTQNQPFPSPTTTFQPRQPSSEPPPGISTTPSAQRGLVPPNAMQLFHTYCNFQPLPLFHHKSFSASENRDQELILAMKALGLRFGGNGIADPGIDRQIKDWTEQSRRMVMARVAEGSVELSTLQTLCILTLIDHTAGHTMKAGTNIRLAVYILQNLRSGSAEFTNLEDEQDERLLLRWSLHMLANLIGGPTPGPSLRTAYNGNSATTANDMGIVGCAIQLSEVWGLAQNYAAAAITPNAPPPWAPHSDYSRITFRHTEFESVTPLRYRLHETRLDELTGAELHRQRDFWGHCLFFQLVFHAIPCLLNHPLLLSARLRNFRLTMPQSFLQHSYEQITLHAGWVLHFIELLESKSYEVSDPTIGQSVVIVATIYLQHSFVEDVFFREKAQAGYDKCLAFLERMALRWPIIERQVDNLGKLRSSISAGEVQNSRQTWSVNVHLLRDILIAAPPKQTAANIMGPGLATDCALQTDSTTPDPDFELIGSAGISGHKTVARNLVTYYPPEQVLQPTPPDLSALLGEPGSAVADSAIAFLQPQDYGRFIDNWLNLPTT